MSGARVLLSLGSNIRPEENLVLAIARLRRAASVEAVSPVLESDPVDAPGAPRFLNAALALRTELQPAELKFGLLRAIEEELGRRRTGDRNAPRSIDLDIALWGDLVVEDPDSGLVIPDPDVLVRAHVILPLAAVAGDVLHPVTGQTLRQVAESVSVPAGIRWREDLRP